MRRSSLLVAMVVLAGAFGARAQGRFTPDDVVMLHLTRGGQHVERTVPFHFPRTRSFRFCIPKDEPYIRSVTVLRDENPAVVLRIPRGAPCVTRTLEAGFYRLVVDHDGTAVPPDGARAFVHVPRIKQGALTSEGTPSGFTCNATYGDVHYTFTAPDGSYVNGNSSSVYTRATPDDLYSPGGWKICPDGLGNYTVGHSFATTSYWTASGPPGTDTLIHSSTSGPGAKFKLVDLGSGQFTLSANFGGTLYPIVVSAGALHWATFGSPAVFTIALVTQFGNSGSYPPLQAGEAGFHRDCGYTPGPRVLFRRDVPDLAPFVSLFATLDNTFSSLRTGPQTATRFFADAGYGGASQVATADVSCLSGPLQDAISSVEVLPDRELVAATKQCQSCNLSSVDLSGLDLSGGQFQNSTFTGANLTGTTFQSANLSGAHLGGADTMMTNTSFLGAVVRCTSFAGADLSTATFQLPQYGIKPVVTTDFSCRLDLTGATFGLSTFPLSQWRFADLTGAKIDLTGVTLSTDASPLDLSGAILDDHDFSGSTLDAANLGCAASGSGAPVCTRLTRAIFDNASLRKANLAGALLNDAQLFQANLDGADLTGAQLRSATLDGAFLRNASLANADLTGAFLKYASFHGGDAAGARLDSTTFTGAYLAGADFSGACAIAANFSGAYLPGASFDGARLRSDVTTGSSASFSKAFLQGASFSGADVENASFLSAYVNLTSGGTLLVQLPGDNVAFAGFQPSAGATPGCVSFPYATSTTTPTTDDSNTCPNGGTGPCTAAQWSTPYLAPPVLPAGCSTATADQSW